MKEQLRKLLGVLVIAAFLLATVNPGSVWAQDESGGGSDVEIPPEVDLQLFDESGNPVPLGSEKSSEMLKDKASAVASFVCATNPALGGEFSSLGEATAAMYECVSENEGTGQIDGALTVYAVSITGELNLTENYSGFTGVIGAGSESTRFDALFMVNGMTSNLLFQGFTLNNYVAINNHANLTLKDIVVDGDNTTQDTGIWIETSGDVTLEDVISDDSYREGINIQNANNVTMKNVKTRNNNSAGIWIEPGVSGINNVTLSQIDSRGNGWDGIGIYGYNGINNVTVTDSSISSSRDDGLYVDGANNVFISNVDSWFNDDDGIDIEGADRVTIYDANLYGNDSDGLDLQGSYGGSDLVWIDGITTMYNGDNGLDIYGPEDGNSIQNLYLNDAFVYQNGYSESSDGAWIGGVVNTSVTNSSFISNHGDQLNIDNDITYSASKTRRDDPYTVTIEDVYVDGMGYGYEGIEVGGFGQSQSVSLNNVTVKNTGDDGIFLYGNDKIDVYNVEATNNGWYCDWDYCAGLFLEDNGTINISDSTFTHNRNAGIWVDSWENPYSAYNVGISRVKANNNGIYDPQYSRKEKAEIFGYDTYGIMISDVYDTIAISNSSATGNGRGIYAQSEGVIALDHVNANNNRFEGARLVGFSGKDISNGDQPASFYLRCSSFNHNGNMRFTKQAKVAGAGLILDGGNDAILEGVNAHGNGDGSGHYDIVAMIGGELVMLEGENCKVEPVVVPQGGSGGACAVQTVNMEQGDGGKVALTGVCEGSIKLDGIVVDGLPGALPEGSTFQSGLEAGLDGGSGLLPEGGSLEVTMAVPEGVDTASLSVLFWDAGAGAWVEIPMAGNEASFSASNGGVVISGVVFNADGTVNFTVNFAGTFVVVSK